MIYIGTSKIRGEMYISSVKQKAVQGKEIVIAPEDVNNPDVQQALRLRMIVEKPIRPEWALEPEKLQKPKTANKPGTYRNIGKKSIGFKFYKHEILPEQTFEVSEEQSADPDFVKAIQRKCIELVSPEPATKTSTPAMNVVLEQGLPGPKNKTKGTVKLSKNLESEKILETNSELPPLQKMTQSKVIDTDNPDPIDLKSLDTSKVTVWKPAEGPAEGPAEEKVVEVSQPVQKEIPDPLKASVIWNAAEQKAEFIPAKKTD